jgi:hypothetical protein
LNIFIGGDRRDSTGKPSLSSGKIVTSTDVVTVVDSATIAAAVESTANAEAEAILLIF